MDDKPNVVFAIITSLKCGHCKKFRGSGSLVATTHQKDEEERIRIYGNRGRGWRWDQEFFISILSSSSSSSSSSSVVLFDIVFMDMSPTRYYSITKYTLSKADVGGREGGGITLRIFKEEIKEHNIVGSLPPPSVLDNYIEKYPCFLFANGSLWNLFSREDSWQEFESLFANDETIRKKYRGSPLYAVAPITNTTPTVLKGYGPKGLFSFEYLQKYKDDPNITQTIDIVEEFRKFSNLSFKDQTFPKAAVVVVSAEEDENNKKIPTSLLENKIMVPSYESSFAYVEWVRPKAFFIDRSIPFDNQTFMYLPHEYRLR